MNIPVPGDTFRLGGMYCYVVNVAVEPTGLVVVEYKNGRDSTAEHAFRYIHSVI